MERNNERIAVIMLITGNLFWGFNNVLTKLALSVASPWTLLSFRFILAFVLLSIPVITGRVKIRFRGKKLLPLVLFALVEPLYFFFESFAIALTNATYTGVVLALSPIFSIIFAALLIHEYPSRREIFFCMFPILGVLLMAVTGMQLGIMNPFGIVCLAGVCLSASAIRITNRGAAMEFSAYERTYAMLLTCCIYFTFRALLEARFDLHAYIEPLSHPVFPASVLGLVLLCSIGSNMLGNYAAGKLTVARYTALSSVSTLFSLFTGVVFLGEPMTVVSFCGAVMIMIGLWGMSHTRVKKMEHAQHKLHMPHFNYSARS